MVKRRARLNEENDPLNSTERVLAGLEQAIIPKDEEVDELDTPILETFLINDVVLEQLSKLYLKLQLNISKRNVPEKEVIVEEAIVQLLSLAETDFATLVELLRKRQRNRETGKSYL